MKGKNRAFLGLTVCVMIGCAVHVGAEPMLRVPKSGTVSSAQSQSTDGMAKRTPSTIEELINGEPLSTATLTPPMEDVCKQVLTLAGAEEGDTYTKLKSCYDFLVTYMNSGSTGGVKYEPYGKWSSFAMDVDESFADRGFGSFEGVCTEYAGMFSVLARYIGLNARMVAGGTLAASGGYTEHKWVEIQLNGDTYLFDPYLEQTFAKTEGTATQNFFCTTYERQGKRFLPERYVGRHQVRLDDGSVMIITG